MLFFKVNYKMISFFFTQELKNALPYIVESIFGYGAEPGWNLDKLSKYQNPNEFVAVRRFLAPESPFLNVIYNLQADSYLQYEFQLTHLPVRITVMFIHVL